MYFPRNIKTSHDNCLNVQPQSSHPHAHLILDENSSGSLLDDLVGHVHDHHEDTGEEGHHQQQGLLVQQNEGVVKEKDKRFIMHSDQHFVLLLFHLKLTKKIPQSLFEIQF